MLIRESPCSDNTAPGADEVLLADGNCVRLTGLSTEQLEQLQWEQEQLFAAQILAHPRNSPQRAQTTALAYDTVCTILAAQQQDGLPFVMGLDPRYVNLVLRLLETQVNRGISHPRLFEIGYGSGTLLKEVSNYGYPVGGIEISVAMRQQAVAALGPQHNGQLLLGELRDVELPEFVDRPSLVYWNDVFEHICPDEILEYLEHVHELLVPGGSLVTITPNWLLRPSDVTCLFCPPRTEAQGLHLKEYRLSEVRKLLFQAGFRRVATPLVVSRRKIYLAGNGLCWAKQVVEPLLDRLPVRVARLLCRAMGLSCTIATK